MKHIYETFQVQFKDLDGTFQSASENHFFQLMYVVSGTGVQTINHHRLPYQPGHLFLITPEDHHSLEVQSPTKVLLIQFTNIYHKNDTLETSNIPRLEYILQHANHQPGCILRKQTDKALVHPIVEAILREFINRDLYNTELIYLLINTLIVIVARNIAEYLPGKVNEQSEGKTLKILEYIQSNIYTPHKLNTKTISEKFGISESYLGRYFKKQFNETLQDYVIKYKLKLVENRLLYSDLRVGEIAFELGFTDESHLNKTFKKHHGITPTGFKKQHAGSV